MPKEKDPWQKYKTGGAYKVRVKKNLAEIFNNVVASTSATRTMDPPVLLPIFKLPLIPCHPRPLIPPIVPLNQPLAVPVTRISRQNRPQYDDEENKASKKFSVVETNEKGEYVSSFIHLTLANILMPFSASKFIKYNVWNIPFKCISVIFLRALLLDKEGCVE